VVIHEFAHKIDMNDGYADGVPPLRGAALTHWQQVLRDEFHRTEGRDSDAVLRPYAWASPAEFFAVATETFFCVPTQLTAAKPVLYAALSDLYQQSPAVDWLPLASASCARLTLRRHAHDTLRRPSPRSFWSMAPRSPTGFLVSPRFAITSVLATQDSEQRCWAADWAASSGRSSWPAQWTAWAASAC